METIVILYLWVSSEMISPQMVGHRYWKPRGEYNGKLACRAAVKELGVRDNAYRCVDTGIPITSKR